MLAGHLLGQEGGGLHHILEDRPGDAQAVGVDGGDMGGVSVNQDHAVTGVQERGAQGASDGASTPDEDIGAHDHGPCIMARVSAMAISQIACISASGRS